MALNRKIYRCRFLFAGEYLFQCFGHRFEHHLCDSPCRGYVVGKHPFPCHAELTDVAKQEQNDNARPEYAGEVPDLSTYDTIYIGAPVWWGDWPMIMYTFFEQNAEGLSGKKLVPFSTHEGSGLSGFDRKLESACPNSTILEGLAIRGNDCQNKQDSVRSEVSDWLSGLGY